MEKSWLKETARDLLAIGSIPFYFLFIIRAMIGEYKIFVYHLVIAAIAIFILYFIIKDANFHISRSFVALVFSSLFYKEMLFTVFAGLVWILMLFGAYYLKRKFGPIIRGIIIGALSSIAGYHGALLV